MPAAHKTGRDDLVVLDLRNPRLGRYSYLLVRQLLGAGFSVYILRRRTPAWSREKYGRLTFQIPTVQSGFGFCLPVQRSHFITDTASRLQRKKWHRQFLIDYDWFSAAPGSLIVPYPMHPFRYEEGWTEEQIRNLRDNSRSIGVWFSGNSDPKAYAGGSIVSKFGLMPRAEVLKTVDESDVQRILLPCPTGERCSGVTKIPLSETLPLLNSDRFDTQHAVVRPAGWRIEDSDWLRLLSHCHFFLAPPGTGMPLSHNIVEALAVGTVPITNYGSYMNPPLTSREALLFSTKEELKECLHTALTMPLEQRQAMSSAASRYYDSFLGGSSLRNTLLSENAPDTTIYLNGESISTNIFKSQPETRAF